MLAFLSQAEQPELNKVNQVRDRLDRFLISFDEFNEVQTKIEEMDEAELNGDEREQFEDTYFSIVARCNALISRNEKNEEVMSVLNERTEEEGSVNSSRNISHTSAVARNLEVKLPAIDLPRFSGKYTNWLEFRDLFESLIDGNEPLSNVQKMYYLKTSLKGGPASVIASLPTTDQNYKIAWDLIKERFENTKYLIKAHVDSILDIPILQRESANGLRELSDTLWRNLRALQSLNKPTSEWGTLLVNIIIRKLDPSTKRAWEMKNPSSNEPTFSDLEKFLNERSQVLESIGCKRQMDKPGVSAKSCLSSQLRCADCSKGHKIYSCELFLAKDMSQRLARVKQLKLCINCLQPGHFMMNCRSSGCRKCGKKHHTVLHRELSAIDCKSSTERGQIETAEDPGKSVSTVTLNGTVNAHDTLLSTAIVLVLSSDGKFHEARVLLDSGSQVNFVTQYLVNKLNLSSRNEELALIGIGGACRKVNSAVCLDVKSVHNNFKMNIKCYILPSITGKLPASELENSLQIPDGITLADPNFYQPQYVDILIGSELFYNLLCIGQIKLGPRLPVLQKTTLGWIIAGEIPQVSKQLTTACNFSLLEEQLTKFWEVEDMNQLGKGTTAEEALCEESFAKFCKRTDNGRFMVPMPFKSQPITLGESYETALNRLKSMERKFARNEKLREGYCNFMQEYEELNHMSKLDSDDIHQGYYLPHHAVMNESSLTTKLRVVFDASAATSTGSSLNNIQCVGPQLQENLFNIIIRFRCYAYVMTADIAKMYRQVLIIPEHRKYQKILWRTSPTNQIDSFQLNTVTYGMKASSFLAIRCLKELANEFRSTYPSASSVIDADFYVDDLITGAN